MKRTLLTLAAIVLAMIGAAAQKTSRNARKIAVVFLVILISVSFHFLPQVTLREKRLLFYPFLNKIFGTLKEALNVSVPFRGYPFLNKVETQAREKLA